MVLYNFKRITVVPNASDFIDIVLSKTQRKTPTVIHKQYAITRIREFYIRKVRYTQQNIHDKLSAILEEFPKLDDIHPFYADLINVLYDKDHYKLALGQLNKCRHLIDGLGKEYGKLLKYGDSLYRCKQLKRAGLGRMCTLMKKQNSSLQYLEQVRQHLARLPTIDPNSRTIIISGFPNVGKSSFINKITRAECEVQPYPFTTKSLFVGHLDYKYIPWQVIDTPGILDRPLEERNTIEMQAITAMAHLRAAILFFIDISSTCGHNIAAQFKLFESIKPLFKGKPLIVVATKCDLQKLENLPQEDKQLFDQLKEEGIAYCELSNMLDLGVTELKTQVCDLLLDQRVQKKMQSGTFKNMLNRLHIAQPIPRDDKIREFSIPESVLKHKEERFKRLEEEEELKDTYVVRGNIGRLTKKKKGRTEKIGSAVLITHPSQISGWDWREQYDLANDEWKFDIVPEFIDGKNILDYIDPEIDKKLEMLEEEEDRRLKEMEENMDDENDDGTGITESEKNDIKDWQNKISMIRTQSLLKHGQNNKNPMPKSKLFHDGNVFAEHMEDLGIDPTDALETIRSRSRGRKRGLSSNMTDDPEEQKKKKNRDFKSQEMKGERGISTEVHKKKVKVMQKRLTKSMSLLAKKGPGDNVVKTDRPKHLFSGKRGRGATHHR
eukprot:TRINITY_DN4737_c0_g1_i1.p1 TRINITY_DN4737_c0_g1~~TRINITY_DN4737_c0_g1_i1.p1  ORF type:complete len:664 (-),score=195.33 TRINITY_DN4737_c0_g1_i1:76-2067(-)